MKCPRCRSTRVYKAKRAKPEKSSVIGQFVVHLVCDVCLTRFYRPRLIVRNTADRKPGRRAA